MGRSVMSIGLLVLGCLVCSAAACEPTEPGTGENNVQARLVDFMPNQNNWNYPDYAACIDLDGNKPIEWRQRYGWASFCGRVGPRGRNSCGCCIKVTNSETGESVTVRVIHTCGGEAMELDKETAFSHIDPTGSANALTVNYEFVDCGDSAHISLPVYRQ